MSRGRKKRRNRHHLTPKSRGGEGYRYNLLLIGMDRHEAWHRLWGNRTLAEVISLLKRVERAKGRLRGRGPGEPD